MKNLLVKNILVNAVITFIATSFFSILVTFAAFHYFNGDMDNEVMKLFITDNIIFSAILVVLSFTSFLVLVRSIRENKLLKVLSFFLLPVLISLMAIFMLTGYEVVTLMFSATGFFFLMFQGISFFVLNKKIKKAELLQTHNNL
jgi:hypothetical protein